MKLTRFFPIILLLLPVATAIHAQTDGRTGISFRADPPDDFDVRDSLENILTSSALNDQARYQACYDLLARRHIAASATEIAGTEIVEPFILDAWKNDDKQRNTNLSGLRWAISLCWRERGGDDKELRDAKERLWMEKALAAALESGNDIYCAIMNHAFGYLEIKRGEVTRAHEYLYEAIKYYDRLERYTMSSEMLYSIGSNFFEIKDVEGMKRVCDQMAEYLEKDTSKQSRYQYNVIRHQYFALLQERERDEKGVADRATVDSAMVYAAANVELVENHIEELSPFWFHGYAYYYLAKELDANYPDRNVEILDALYKALETAERDLMNTFVGGENAAFSEFLIMVNSLLMKALFRTGQTEEARTVLNDTMEQLSEFESFENLNAIRSFIYKFAVEFHQSKGNIAEALRFQKLYTANETRAHEREKVRAINEMAAKYETEKKQIRIETLTRENRTARQILWLVVGLALAAVAAGVMVIVWGRLRRRNVEQKLYETALLAELRQEEIEKMQLPEQTPVADTIEKIARQVAASVIDKSIKSVYLDNLSHLDGVVLENAYRNSEARLTALDIKYIICFNAGMSVPDIGTVFSIEPASVNTVRYRIRKKFAPNDPFRTII